jgi:hypothetical protein
VGRKVAEDAINLKVVAGKGEPKRFAVISNDGEQGVFGQVILTAISTQPY